MRTQGGRRAIVRIPHFLEWVAFVGALAVIAVGIYFRWGFLKLLAVVVTLGVSVCGGYLLLGDAPRLLGKLRGIARKLPGKLRGIARHPLVRSFPRRAAVIVALGLSAVGVYVLWGLQQWAAVLVALGVSAFGIYSLRGAARELLGKLRGVARDPLFLRWMAVFVALGVSALGILLLWGVWDGKPVAAAFTRVGGATHVETALEASRFWLIPPQIVVETRPGASQKIMMGAARCAVTHDAPLLFTSSDPRRQHLVNATVNDWRKIETPNSLVPSEKITIKRQRNIFQAIPLPEVITIQTLQEVGRCAPNPADIARLSTLKVPDPLIPLPQVLPRHTLAKVVVFAAAIEPGHPLDVAVGLALAAHMARANGEDVSLVVVPHYLESDLELEKTLEDQHQLVTGGVVLGDTATVPEDTRVLLRQLLTSRDRQGVLGQVQDNLGSLEPLIAALLALVGLGTAGGIGGREVIKYLEAAKQKRAEQTADHRLIIPREEEPMSDVNASEVSDWITAMDGKGKVKVTVWLRSGRQVTGIIASQFPGNTHEAAVFKITDASLAPQARKIFASPSPGGKCVLVSVKDIEMIEINDSGTAAAKAGQT